ncbi:hypothetical protein ZIOFF_005975 [Zingiber officinale]|uniref:ABC transporter domain-containing protein n=1 Tax=Zingiber officinale TaxID=94328 RepID=A0A8J5LV89_ZINOF|nr:hypothetical protein ZIOFF_005975 [Zingiber officinale]
MGGSSGSVPTGPVVEDEYATVRTSVWWDIENCQVRKACDPHLIAQNISLALAEMGYRGPVSISAFGDTSKIAQPTVQALNNTGIALNHVPAVKVLTGMIQYSCRNLEKIDNSHLLAGDMLFTDVGYKVLLKRIASNTEKDILQGITGSARPGELLAVMGPSASGKTTLLSLLGGRTTANIVQGSITYNDEPYSKSLKGRIGFVTQDDVLFAHLTVRETLTYAALLRLPRTMSRQKKEERVVNVITELGLQRCQDTIVGGSFIRGVSGGERKRVCIGNEILVNPSLLFLDEPTSGLDSTTTLRVVQVLTEIAEPAMDMLQSGKTVVTTIHQPSIRLFHRFDKLILLGKGSLFYFGRASKAMSYFSSTGFSPLIAMNPAEFLVDLANGNTNDVTVPTGLEDKLQSKESGRHTTRGKLSAEDVHEWRASPASKNFISYELSLRDLVETPRIVKKVEEAAEMRQEGAKNKAEKATDRSKGGLFLKTSVPVLDGGKTKSSRSNSFAKVSPKLEAEKGLQEKMRGYCCGFLATNKSKSKETSKEVD